MADRDLRRLERASSAAPCAQAEARLVRARVRSGEISGPQLELASSLGYPLALEVSGGEAREVETFDHLAPLLCVLLPEVGQRRACAALCRVLTAEIYLDFFRLAEADEAFREHVGKLLVAGHLEDCAASPGLTAPDLDLDPSALDLVFEDQEDPPASRPLEGQ